MEIVGGHATELMLRSIYYCFRAFLISQPIRQRKKFNHERRLKIIIIIIIIKNRKKLRDPVVPEQMWSLSAKACPASYVH